MGSYIGQNVAAAMEGSNLHLNQTGLTFLVSGHLGKIAKTCETLVNTRVEVRHFINEEQVKELQVEGPSWFLTPGNLRKIINLPTKEYSSVEDIEIVVRGREKRVKYLLDDLQDLKQESKKLNVAMNNLLELEARDIIGSHWNDGENEIEVSENALVRYLAGVGESLNRPVISQIEQKKLVNDIEIVGTDKNKIEPTSLLMNELFSNISGVIGELDEVELLNRLNDKILKLNTLNDEEFKADNEKFNQDSKVVDSFVKNIFGKPIPKSANKSKENYIK